MESEKMMLVGCKECGCTGVSEINLQNYKVMFDAVMQQKAILEAKLKQLEKKRGTSK